MNATKRTSFCESGAVSGRHSSSGAWNGFLRSNCGAAWPFALGFAACPFALGWWPFASTVGSALRLATSSLSFFDVSFPPGEHLVRSVSSPRAMASEYVLHT